MILNCIEAIAWPAVAAFTVQGMLKQCEGTTCLLSWVIIPLAVALRYVTTLVLLHFIRRRLFLQYHSFLRSYLINTCSISLISTLAAFLSIGDWWFFKKTGVKPGTREVTREVKLESGTPVGKKSDSEEVRYEQTRR